MKNYVDQEILTRLNKLNSWRPVSRIIFEYSLIVIIAYFVHTNFSIPLYLIGIILIGTRQHALAVLIHEGAHYRLHRNKAISEALGEFISNSFMISLATYRNYHFSHHNNAVLNTKDDPDFARRDPEQWKFPKKKIAVFFIFMKDLFGLSTFALLKEIKFNKQFKGKRSAQFELVRFIFWVTIIALAVYFQVIHFYFIYYIPAVFTSTKAILRMRALGDHYGMDNRHHTQQMRDTVCGPIEKMIFFSCGSGYHALHHIYPMTPYYNLEKLHKYIYQNPEYIKIVQTSFGIRAMLRELCI